MKFYVSTAFLDTREAVEIAKAADDLGYHGMAIPDHVVNLETLTTPYPYTKDGQRRWEAFTDWPVGDDRGSRVGDVAPALRDDGVPAGDAGSVLGGEIDWYRRGSV
jgi:alkanesulfonate monooxygenase SsuD/methylene tetrahydromethanopterin reductase-like flavin-dependent oxidoreductase (luciferase family)